MIFIVLVQSIVHFNCVDCVSHGYFLILYWEALVSSLYGLVKFICILTFGCIAHLESILLLQLIVTCPNVISVNTTFDVMVVVIWQLKHVSTLLRREHAVAAVRGFSNNTSLTARQG